MLEERLETRIADGGLCKRRNVIGGFNAPSPGAAMVFSASVGGDMQKPCLHMLVVVEFDGALEQAEKDILHDILRIGGVAQVREREPIDAAPPGCRAHAS